MSTLKLKYIRHNNLPAYVNSHIGNIEALNTLFTIHFNSSSFGLAQASNIKSVGFLKKFKRTV